MTDVIVTIEIGPLDFDLLRAAVVQMALMVEVEVESGELTDEQVDERAAVLARARRLASELGA